MTSTEATLSWSDGTTDGGRPVQGYNVYLREKGTKKWNKITKSLVKSKSHTLTNLEPEKEYEAQVTAVNEAGESEPSPVSKPFQLTEDEETTKCKS